MAFLQPPSLGHLLAVSHNSVQHELAQGCGSARRCCQHRSAPAWQPLLVGMAASAWPGPAVLVWADWNWPFLHLSGIAVSWGGSSDCLLAAVPIAGLALAGFHVSQNEFALE